MMTTGVSVIPIERVPHSRNFVLRGKPLRENSTNHQTGMAIVIIVNGARNIVIDSFWLIRKPARIRSSQTPIRKLAFLNKSGKGCGEGFCLRSLIEVKKVGTFRMQTVKDNIPVVVIDKKSENGRLSEENIKESANDNTEMAAPNKIPSVLKINKSILGIFRFFEAISFRLWLLLECDQQLG